jgi:hypothetical protein
MRTRRLVATILAAGLAMSTACGQSAQPPAPAKPSPAPAKPAPAQPAPAPGPGGVQVFQAPPATTPKYDSLVRKGPDGKVIPIEGVVDAHSLLRNPMVDEATRQRARAAIEDWGADVNQLAIDNLDFLEKIDDEGLIDKFDFNDNDQLRMMSQIMVPFMSAGPLTKRLQDKGLISAEQGQLNSIIVNDYLQALFNENLGGGFDPIRGDEPEAKQKEKLNNINKLTHFLYYTTCRDARESYHQMMIDSAPNAERIVSSLSLSADQGAKLKPALAAVRKATTDADKMKQVHDLLKHLNFDQRRAYLQKAVEMGAAKNPVDAVRSKTPSAG